MAGRAVRRGRRRHAPAGGAELHPGGVPVNAPKLSWSDLAGARVGVWGLGREGHANLRKLMALGVEPVLVDDRPPAAVDGPPVLSRPVLATGDGGLAALERCDVVIKTPGLSRYRPEVARLTGLGIPVVGGLGLWLAEADLRRVLVVTGTKGKSTTSSVTGHLLAGLGYRCMLGGNIGAPPYDPATDGDFDYWVIEVSSYQATDLPCSPSPRCTRITSTGTGEWSSTTGTSCPRAPSRAPSSPWRTATATCSGSAPGCSARGSSGSARTKSPARTGWSRSCCPVGTTAATRSSPAAAWPRSACRASATTPGCARRRPATGRCRAGSRRSARSTASPSSTTACPPTCCPPWPRSTPSPAAGSR